MSDARVEGAARLLAERFRDTNWCTGVGSRAASVVVCWKGDHKPRCIPETVNGVPVELLYTGEFRLCGEQRQSTPSPSGS